MTFMRLALCLLAPTVSTIGTALAADTGGWLRLGRGEIIRIFDLPATEPLPVDPHARREVARLQNDGDSVWVYVNEGVKFRLAMAGKGDRVHSLRIYIPILNLSRAQSDRAFEMLKAFFAAEFP